MSLLNENLQKLDELQPHVRWAAHRWTVDCFNEMLYFRVLEVYRTPERQMSLYALGRWVVGKVVTWTKSSEHTKRLACDIVPLNCDYEPIEKIAKKYNITRPLAKYPYYDFGHFEFSNVKSFPIILSLDAKINALKRGINRTIPPVKNMLQNQLNRLLSRSK